MVVFSLPENLWLSFHSSAVDGGWSTWSTWTSCNKPCGGGSRQRFRSCDSPMAEFGGEDCGGEDMEDEDCNIGVPCIRKMLFFTNMLT